MDILWAAAGICAIVFVLFFAMAQHWQRIIRQQSWTIRHLAERVKNLEEVGDPEFRRRLGDSAPMPLEQVFQFSFRLSDRFWRDQLRIGNEDWDFIRAFGSFVGSVKLEQWRSHTVATVTEILPESSTARWQTRSLDFYPDHSKNNEALPLWELRLSPANGSADRPASLELILRQNAVELCGHYAPAISAAGGGMLQGKASGEEIVFFTVPLDSGRLVNFRSHDPANGSKLGSGSGVENVIPIHEGAWQAFYSNKDEVLGVEWQLRLRDLSKKAEWERWKVFETAAIPFAGNAKH
jgi:hypothetical protein